VKSFIEQFLKRRDPERVSRLDVLEAGVLAFEPVRHVDVTGVDALEFDVAEFSSRPNPPRDSKPLTVQFCARRG